MISARAQGVLPVLPKSVTNGAYPHSVIPWFPRYPQQSSSKILLFPIMLLVT